MTQEPSPCHNVSLDFEGWKKEIARLSGGENITQTTLISAEEQLRAAEAFRECKL